MLKEGIRMWKLRRIREKKEKREGRGEGKGWKGMEREGI